MRIWIAAGACRQIFFSFVFVAILFVSSVWLADIFMESADHCFENSSTFVFLQDSTSYFWLIISDFLHGNAKIKRKRKRKEENVNKLNVVGGCHVVIIKFMCFFFKKIYDVLETIYIWFRTWEKSFTTGKIVIKTCEGSQSKKSMQMNSCATNLIESNWANAFR